MRKAAIGALVLSGFAAVAIAAPGPKDVQIVPGAPVKFDAMVVAVREVPAGNPLPGLHIDAKVNGRDTDIYLSPVDFAVKYGLHVAKGQYVRILGYPAAGSDVILTREVTTGIYDAAHNIFRPNLTIYLRNDDGPFWVDTSKPLD